MKLTVEGIVLSDAILKVVKACATKTTLPVMECIKLSAKNDSLTLSATDGEIAIIKTIKAEIFEEGEICVSGRYFSEFIKKLENSTVTLFADNSKMDIIYDDNKSSMQILSAENFPRIETLARENSFKIKTSKLKELISATIFCCATDDSRPILKGCEIVVKGNEIDFTAIDGFRLASMQSEIISSTSDMKLICYARTLNEIEKMLPDNEEETEIFVNRGMMLISYDDTVLTSKLLSGDFINKNNIIPKEFMTSVEVSRDELKASIERAAVLVRTDKNSLILFDISSNIIEISSNSDIGNVKEQVKCETDGRDIVIAMNSKYINEAISALKDEKIILSFNGPAQPFILQNKENNSILYLILPVRMVNNA